MKIKFLIHLIFCLLTTSIYSQTPSQNLDKYWNYRNRLKTKFLVSAYQWNLPEGRNLGVNIPANLYNPTIYNSTEVTQSSIKWGDATAYLGYYIAVLATEYKLLQISGQDVIPTLTELWYTLTTLERLDWHAEGLYCYGCKDGFTYDNTWINTNYSTSNGGCLNGFFIRDDVPLDFTSYWANKGYPDFAGLNVISDYSGDLLSGGHGDEESQDQIWNLLVGLSLVKKLVDYSGNMTDGDGESITFAQCAKKTTNRLIQYPLYSEGSWSIKNPCTGNFTERGGSVADLLPNAFWFAEAGNWITDRQYGDYHQGWNPAYWLPLPYGYPLTSPVFYNDNAKLALSTISGNSPWAITYDNEIFWIQSCAAYYNRNFPDNYNGVKNFAFEHFPMMNIILHDLSPNHYYFNHYMSFVERLLDLAPYDGPFRYIIDTNGDGIYDGNDYPVREWSTQMRLTKPIGESLDNGENAGEYNGLDYMLLHNLYWLVYYSKFNQDKQITENFPYIYTDVGNFQYPLGKQGNGITLSVNSLQNIVANNTINSDGEVVYRAGSSIILNAGFNTEAGASFIATVDEHAGLVYKNTSLLKSTRVGKIENIDESPFNIQSLNKNSISGQPELFFKVFPNPTTGIINIDYSNAENELSELRIFDLLGTVIKYDKILPAKNIIDISQQPAGIYTIEIKNKAWTKKVKVIKQ